MLEICGALIFSETSSLQKFYKDKELFPVLKYIQQQSQRYHRVNGSHNFIC